jgi:membrane associated rhomboid family serine protease
MVGVAALLWVIEIVDQTGDHHWDLRFGLKPRQIDGLWGVVTQPFLHSSYSHLFSNMVPLIGVGWVLLLSGLRVWLFVTAFVVVVGDVATWLVAPSGIVVGASALVFGWMGYLLARAYFSRRLKWILTAVAVLIFFGTLLGNLLPSVDARVSWQSHLCGFLAGVLVGWLLHPRRQGQQRGAAR